MSTHEDALLFLGMGCVLVPAWDKRPPKGFCWKGDGPSCLIHTERELWAWRDAPMFGRIIPEGEVVLDYDDRAGYPVGLPETFAVASPRGLHLWFEVSDTVNLRKTRIELMGRQVDLCPAGTLEFIVGEGRCMASEVPVARLPSEAEGLIAQALSRLGGVGSERPGGRDRKLAYSYYKAATDKLFWFVATAPEGHRNIRLNQAAFRFGELGVPFEKAVSTLTRAAERAGLREPEIYTTIVSGWSAGSPASETSPPEAQ